MEIDIRHEQRRVPVTVMAIKGDLTAESSEQLKARFDQEHKLGTNNLLIDLKHVGFISSSGLRAIHGISNSLEQQNGAMKQGMSAGTYKFVHFKLANASEDVRGVLKMTGYDSFLDIYDDTETALAAF
jgi:anti-anti-sigma factor